jgi:hypothetical protein
MSPHTANIYSGIGFAFLGTVLLCMILSVRFIRNLVDLMEAYAASLEDARDAFARSWNSQMKQARDIRRMRAEIRAMRFKPLKPLCADKKEKEARYASGYGMTGGSVSHKMESDRDVPGAGRFETRITRDWVRNGAELGANAPIQMAEADIQAHELEVARMEGEGCHVSPETHPHLNWKPLEEGVKA